MKKILKWFTLVEILIVIVIIGILIWALVPRMQSAQWRARDVARKNDLSQLQAAIITSYQDKGGWPQVNGCASDSWCDVEDIQAEILAAWMNGVPRDPLSSNVVSWLWDAWTAWQYRYLTVNSYGAVHWGFALMAKTEVEWWSNWVVCNTASSTTALCDAFTSNNDCTSHTGCTWNTSATTSSCTGTYTLTSIQANGIITANDDIRDLKPCWSLTKNTNLANDACLNPKDGSACEYANESQLRYVLFN